MPNNPVNLAALDTQAASRRNLVKITAIKAMQGRDQTRIKVETDAGIAGYGPCGTSGPFAREVIAGLEGPRLKHLGLIGRDPLAIGVHHQHMFYTYPQRRRETTVMSGIDIALWDIAGKLLGQPVSKLLGGNFRDKIRVYSHCGGGNFLSKSEWVDRVAKLRENPCGFTAYKVDIHHALKGNMQEAITSITPREARNVHKGYRLAREAFGDDTEIIVHCHNELDLPSAIKVAQAVEPIEPLFLEDPLMPVWSDSWKALRATTRIPLMTGENIELAEQAMPFILNQVVDHLQPDLINAGGITGVKLIADIAALYRIPISMHNVRGYLLNMASQQISAALFNCPWMECRGNAYKAPEAAKNKPVIKDGYMQVSTEPGLGVYLDYDYLKATKLESEPWWGDAVQ